MVVCGGQGEGMERLSTTRVRRWQNGAWQNIQEQIAPEERIRVVWSGGERVLWAWPHDLESLCLGHVILESGRETWLDGRGQGKVTLLADKPGIRTFQVAFEAPYSTDTGKIRHAEPGRLSPDGLLHAMRLFLTLPGSCPGLWKSTGCFHRAGMFDVGRGLFVHLAEDTGRHNCLDRLVGWSWLHGLHPGEHVLFLSSRITGSLYVRARKAGFRFLVGRGAVTSIPLAETDAMTVVGFCRTGEGRFTVFQDSDCRILPAGGTAPENCNSALPGQVCSHE